MASDDLIHLSKDEFWAEFKRLAAGMSARQLGKKLGVASSNGYRWREGISAPPAVSRSFILDKLRAAREAMDRTGERGDLPEKDEDGWPVYPSAL